MKKWRQRLYIFFSNESGATAIEYAVMGSLIVAVCAATIASIGARLVPWYEATANVLR